MASAEEVAFASGQRSAWQGMLRTALRELGYADADAKAVAWVNERMDAIRVLREICAEHGDNDWPDDAYLSEIIDKHLGKHLDEDPS